LSDSLRQHRSGYYIDQDIGGSNAEEARDLDPPYWSVARRRFDGLHHRVIQARVRQRLYCSSFEGFALSLTAASHLPIKLSGIAMDVGAGFIRMVPTAIMPWTMVRLWRASRVRLLEWAHRTSILKRRRSVKITLGMILTATLLDKQPFK
jgi:hypothetical protein